MSRENRKILTGAQIRAGLLVSAAVALPLIGLGLAVWLVFG